jgi:hypothetical protein
MLHPSVFWVDSLIVVSMAVQEGSNRHAVWLGCEEDVTMWLQQFKLRQVAQSFRWTKFLSKFITSEAPTD